MKLIIGLGNPGKEYSQNRHNMGFRVLDQYAQKQLGSKIKWELETKFKSEVIRIENDLMLVKPQTFMNNSGLAVSLIINFYKIPIENVIVVHDELDLPLGQIRIKRGGGAAGHHGIESIIEKIGNANFTRVRVGVENRDISSRIPSEEYVLLPFAKDEQETAGKTEKLAVAATDLLVQKGIEEAQNKFNAM